MLDETGMHSTKTEREEEKKQTKKTKRGEKRWTWKIEWDIGLQDEVKEEREKPELYVIQSFLRVKS